MKRLQFVPASVGDDRNRFLRRRFPFVLRFGDVAEGESELRLVRIGVGRGVLVDALARFCEAFHERKDSRVSLDMVALRSFDDLNEAALLFDRAACVPLGA